jgi:hypothetical protein
VRVPVTAHPLVALECGLAVFPLPAGGKVAPDGWHGMVTRDPDAVAAWPPGSNVGVGCRASSVVGLDLDRKGGVDGVDTLAALCAAARRPWPLTFTVATAHDGFHLYFRAPAGVDVPSTIGRLGPGIDVRAPGRWLGGYLVGPGSVVDGRVYTIARALPVAPLPGWLAAQLAATARLVWAGGARSGQPGS